MKAHRARKRTYNEQDLVNRINKEKERIEALERANGVGSSGEKGIAHRIDSLEERIKELEQ